MNFFRSGLFAESRASSEVSNETGQETSDEGENEAPAAAAAPTAGWSFGDLVKSLGKVSGEVLQAYKQDLSEFADGLKKESEIVKEVTVYAVKDFPHTLETSAVVAQESLESVGQSLEEFGGSLWRGTSELIATVKEAVQKVDEEAIASAKAKGGVSRDLSAGHPSWKYSRYEAQVNAMQRDSSTYCDEPEDGEDFAAWRSSFNLGEKKADIEALLKENAFMQELEARIVPLIVEYDSFWTRYFYRLHKLQQAEDARADLVKRATSSTEEELSWDVEEEAEEARHNPDGSQDVRPRGEVVDKAVPHDIETEQEALHVQVEESSESSSPSGGRKSEEEEITAEHPGGGGGHDEESSVSEGSTGSDWLVVQEDNQGVVDTPEKTTPALIKGKETLPAVLARRQALEAEEPELEEIGDLTVDDTPKEISEARKTVVDKKPVAEEPEDWGDWE